MVGFDPKEKVGVKLDCVDGGKPDDQRATFFTRHMTGAETRQARAMRQAALDAKTDGEQIELLKDAVEFAVSGWENLVNHKGDPVPFTRDAMEAEFTPRLLLEVAREIPTAVWMTEADRKN